MSLAHLGAPAAVLDLNGLDLNGKGHYLTVGWFSISWGNAVVIALMLVVFALALVLPFPGGRR